MIIKNRKRKKMNSNYFNSKEDWDYLFKTLFI